MPVLQRASVCASTPCVRMLSHAQLRHVRCRACGWLHQYYCPPHFRTGGSGGGVGGDGVAPYAACPALRHAECRHALVDAVARAVATPNRHVRSALVPYARCDAQTLASCV